MTENGWQTICMLGMGFCGLAVFGSLFSGVEAGTLPAIILGAICYFAGGFHKKEG